MDATSAARAAYRPELVENAVRQRHDGHAQASLGHVAAAFTSAFNDSARRLLTEIVKQSGSTAGLLFRPVTPTWPKQAPHPRGRHAAKTPELRLQFDVSTPQVKQWIDQHAADLVMGVSEEVRNALNETMQGAFEQHLTPSQAAVLIEDVIGLDSRRADALENFLDDIRENLGGTVYAGDRKVNVPEEITDDFLEAQADRYSGDLLADRAIAIARTETMAAANGGQELLWEQAVQEGLLDPSRDERVWITTPDDRLCPQCDAMDGARAPLGGEFESEDGPVDGPPLHPNCRCAQGIAEIEQVQNEPTDAAGFDEGDHPRDDHGRFAPEGGGSQPPQEQPKLPRGQLMSSEWKAALAKQVEFAQEHAGFSAVNVHPDADPEAAARTVARASKVVLAYREAGGTFPPKFEFTVGRPSLEGGNDSANGHFGKLDDGGYNVSIDPELSIRGSKAHSAALQAIESGWSAKSDPLGTVDHELAHALHYKEISKVRTAKVPEHIYKQVSTYAGKNAAEFVAETVTGWKGGKSYGAEVWNEYKKHSGPKLKGMPL